MKKTVFLILLSLMLLPAWAQRPTNLHQQLVYSGVDFDQIHVDNIDEIASHKVIITIGGVSFEGTVGPDKNVLTKDVIDAETDNAVKELMNETGINMGFFERMKSEEAAVKDRLNTSVDEKYAKIGDELFSRSNMLSALSYFMKAGGIFFSPLGMASSAVDKANGQATGADMAATAFNIAAVDIAKGEGRRLESVLFSDVKLRGQFTGTLTIAASGVGAIQQTGDFAKAGFELAKYLDEHFSWSFRDKEDPIANYWVDVIRLDALYRAVPAKLLEILDRKYDLGWKIECNTWFMNKDKALFGTAVKQAWHMNCTLKRISGDKGSALGHRGVFQGAMNLDIYNITGEYDPAFMAGTMEKTDLVKKLRQAPVNLSDKTVEPTSLVKYLSTPTFVVDTSGGGQSTTSGVINEEAGMTSVIVDLDLGKLSDNTVFHLTHELNAKVNVGAWNDGTLNMAGITGKADATFTIKGEMQADKRVFVLYAENQQDENYARIAGKTAQGQWQKVVQRDELMTDRDVFSDLNGPAKMLIE